VKLRDKIVVFGAMTRANIRPTHPGPVIVPEYEDFAGRKMRLGLEHAVGQKPTRQCQERDRHHPGLLQFILEN
jgi:hypothetical protein